MKRRRLVCSIADTDAGATCIQGHLQIVGGIANHQGTRRRHAELGLEGAADRHGRDPGSAGDIGHGGGFAGQGHDTVVSLPRP